MSRHQKNKIFRLLPALIAICALINACSSLTKTKDSYVLENEAVRFEISRKNGTLLKAYNLQSNRELCIEKSYDKYALESEDGKADSKSDESRDELVKEASYGKGEITLHCSNKDLGIEIIKTYELQENDNKLCKKVVFKKDGPQSILMKYSSAVNIPIKFRKGAYFHHLERGGWTRGNQKILADKIKPSSLIANGTVSQICLVNPNAGYGIGHYKYLVNGRYDLNNSFVKSHYTQSGWEIGISGGFIGNKGSLSSELHYQIFKGDQINFNQEYIKLPAYQATINYSSPKWLKDVRFIAGWAIGHALGASVDYNKFRELFDQGEPLFVWPMSPWFDPMWEVRGDFLDGEIEKYDFGKNEIKTLKRVRKKCPGLKIGNYTWHYSIGPKSKLYKTHPEWAAFKKDMTPAIQRDSHFACPKPDILNPKYISYVHSRIKRVLDTLKYDIYYIDEIGPKCHAYVNWKNKSIINNYDWIDYWNSARKTIRSCGKDKIYFANAYLPITTGFDCGYLEIGHFKWINDDPKKNKGKWGSKTWRANADRIMFAKLYQKDPSTWVALLFWGHHSIKEGRNNDPYCSNYLIGFGLKPSHPGESDAKEMGSFWNSLLAKMPYINAAYETRGLKMIDADISPRWWLDDSIDVEAYSLKQGNNAFMPVISHKENIEEIEISADAKKLGLDKSKETYVWVFDMSDPWKIKQEEVGSPEYKNKRIMTPTLLSSWKFKGERLCCKIKTRPKLLSMIVATQTPGVIYSVNRRPSQLLLSSALDAKIEGKIDEAAKTNKLVVTSSKNTIEILAMAPAAWGRIKVKTNGIETKEFEEKNKFGKRFVLLSIPKGKNEVEISKLK